MKWKRGRDFLYEENTPIEQPLIPTNSSNSSLDMNAN